MRGTVAERFWAKVDRTGDCWIWLAAQDDEGYGRFKVTTGIVRRAHRVAWMLLVGPLTPGLVLDHLCRTRLCVNPAHLREVTHRENLMAPGSLNRGKANAVKTHCIRGHEFNAENTYAMPSGGRQCRICRRNAKRSAA